jgi:ADP-ribose pyrophosphatase
MHYEARHNRPPSYPERFSVSDAHTAWEVALPDYDPPYFVDPTVLAAHRPGGWADPEEIAALHRELRSFEGPVAVVGRMPRNPRGRTGLSGRGLLGRWGANFAADAIIARDTPGGPEMIAIQRRDSGQWAIPGGMADGDEEPHTTAARELHEETGVEIDMSDAQLVYRGYVDDRRNTDHAWMETTALLRRIADDEAQALELRAGDDAAVARWQPLVDEFIDQLYASHGLIVRAARELLQRWPPERWPPAPR